MKFFFLPFLFFILTTLTIYGSDLTSFEENGKWGFKNFYTDKVEIKPQFQAADFFHNGIAVVKLKGKWGYINEKGKWIIDPEFQDARPFNKGIAPVKLNDKWGFINEKGKWIIKPEFQDARFFENGTAPAKLNDKWGFINEKGEWVIKPEFQEIGPFVNDYAVVIVDGKYGLLDRSFKYKIKPQNDELGIYVSDGFISVKNSEGKWGFIDLVNDFRIPCIYDDVFHFYNGFAPVFQFLYCFFCGFLYSIVLPFAYDSIFPPEGGETCHHKDVAGGSLFNIGIMSCSNHDTSYRRCPAADFCSRFDLPKKCHGIL